MRKLTVRIKRYDPERDDSPHGETYRVEADSTDRVLDVLLRVKWEQDDTLALRYSCAHGVCGSDAMRINGFNSLSCTSRAARRPARPRLDRLARVLSDLGTPPSNRMIRQNLFRTIDILQFESGCASFFLIRHSDRS